MRERPEEMWRAADVVQDFWRRQVGARADRMLSIWGQRGSDLPLLLLHREDELVPLVVLHAHLDVVPAADDAFVPRRDGEHLLGRGSADMKGAAAAMIGLAAELLPQSAPFGVLLTWNEEEGGRKRAGLGTESYLRDLCPGRPRFFLSGERSGLQIAVRSKGMLRIRATVRGRSAHAATPWEGENALDALVAGLARLARPSDPDGATVCLTELAAGSGAGNVVPAEANAVIDARFVTAAERQAILDNLRACVPGAHVDVMLDEPGASCPEDDPHLVALCQSLRECGVEPVLFTKPHASDVRLANELGIPGVVFGPDGGNVHADGEWLSLPSLQIYIDVLRRFVLSARGVSGS